MVRRKRSTEVSLTSFSSEQYYNLPTWQKVIFWIGIISFLHPVYWLVRLILYLVVQKRPIHERVNFYAMQTLIFGFINVFALIVLIVVLTVLAIAFSFMMVAGASMMGM